MCDALCDCPPDRLQNHLGDSPLWEIILTGFIGVRGPDWTVDRTLLWVGILALVTIPLL